MADKLYSVKSEMGFILVLADSAKQAVQSNPAANKRHESLETIGSTFRDMLSVGLNLKLQMTLIQGY